MKLSKKLLALGLSVGLAVSASVPVFAAYSDPLAGVHTIFESIEDKTYTAQEKAEIMALAEKIVDAWDDVVYGDGYLKLRDSRGTEWVVSYDGSAPPVNGTVEGAGGVSWDAYNGMPVTYMGLYLNNSDIQAFHGSSVVATHRMGDYEDKMEADFENLFHKLHFDALGKDFTFKIYEKENTNVTDIGDTLLVVDVWDLLDTWTHEGSLLNDLRTALSLAKTKAADAATTTTGSSTAPAANTNCVTCNTTTTTTTTTTAAAPATAARPAGTASAGLPLANTATNYGNVMALGLGAMVVALGVFAYSKKVTA